MNELCTKPQTRLPRLSQGSSGGSCGCQNHKGAGTFSTNGLIGFRISWDIVLGDLLFLSMSRVPSKSNAYLENVGGM